MSISAEPDDFDPDLPGFQENSESEAESDTASERAESDEDSEFAIAFRETMRRSQQFTQRQRLSRKRSSHLRSEPSSRQLLAVGEIWILQTALEATAQNDRAQIGHTVATDRTQIRRSTR